MSNADPILAAVASSGAQFDIIDCDPDLADTAEFCAHYGYSPDKSANAIVIAGKSDPPVYAMCVLLATTQVDVNGVGRKRLGTRKASFAPAEQTAELTGMTLGGVTPFGKPDALALWIDARVMDCDRVIVGGGSRDRKFYVEPSALAALPNAEVVTDLAKVRSPRPE